MQLDEGKAEKATAVLRVRRLAAEGGDKWAWDKLEVLAVLKDANRSGFGKTLEVAHYSWEPGVPKGECTVYLEPYAESGERRWKLLGGSAKTGVSHVTPAA